MEPTYTAFWAPINRPFVLSKMRLLSPSLHCGRVIVKFGSIAAHSYFVIRGHMIHREFTIVHYSSAVATRDILYFSRTYVGRHNRFIERAHRTYLSTHDLQGLA